MQAGATLAMASGMESMKKIHLDTVLMCMDLEQKAYNHKGKCQESKVPKSMTPVAMYDSATEYWGSFNGYSRLKWLYLCGGLAPDFIKSKVKTDLITI